MTDLAEIVAAYIPDPELLGRGPNCHVTHGTTIDLADALLAYSRWRYDGTYTEADVRAALIERIRRWRTEGV